MAVTKIIPLHNRKGNSVLKSISDRIDYAENDKKTENGKFVSAYMCAPETAAEEFLLSRKQYLLKNSDVVRNGKEVIAYHIIQSFKPGEITPEKANELGYELAIRFTKGKHAFVVSTHTDKEHIHNHIIFNAFDLEGDRKFRDFLRSGRAVQKISDMICIENGLSVIEAKWKKAKDQAEKQEIEKSEQTGDRIHFLIDVERKLSEKGKGYAGWAKTYNAKEMAKTVLFLQENKIESYQSLCDITDQADKKYHALRGEIKKREETLDTISELRNQIVSYVKTKDVYAEYRKHGYSKNFYESYRAEIELHKAAKKYFDQLGLEKLPRVKTLNEEFQKTLEEKRALYREYKSVKDKMKNFEIAKKNVETILEIDAKKPKQKQQKREKPTL